MLPAARKASIQLSQKTKLLHVSSRFALPAGPAGTAGRQACPQGALVVSGGFGLDPESRGSASPRLELNFPDPHGWNVRAVNGEAGSAEAAQARTHAICLGTSEGADIRDFRTVFVVEKDVTVNADNGTARQPVGCGEGAYVLGGGTHTIKGRSANIETQESFPDSPSSWTIAMTNRGDKKAGNATVRLYAMCIKK